MVRTRLNGALHSSTFRRFLARPEERKPNKQPVTPRAKPMRKTLRALSLFSIGLLAVGSLVATYFAFHLVHFLVTDGIGDTREMLGDGPVPSWWHTFFAGWWYLFYIPAGLFGAFSLWFCSLCVALFRSHASNQNGSRATPGTA